MMPQRFVSPDYAKAPVDDFQFSYVPRQGGETIACPWWRFVSRVERVNESFPPRRISELFEEHFDCRNHHRAGDCDVVRGLSGTRHFEWPFVVGVNSAAGWRWIAFQRRIIRPLPGEVQRILHLAESGAFDPPPMAGPVRIQLPNGAIDATVSTAC